MPRPRACGLDQRQPGSRARVFAVSITDPNPVQSTPLEADHRYRISVGGTVSVWCNAGGECTWPEGYDHPKVEPADHDALYCYVEWRCGSSPLYDPKLQIDGQALDALGGNGRIAYNAGHTYSIEVTGRSGRLTFSIIGAGGSTASGAYSVTITDLGPTAARHRSRILFHFLVVGLPTHHQPGLADSIVAGLGSITVADYKAGAGKFDGEAIGKIVVTDKLAGGRTEKLTLKIRSGAVLIVHPKGSAVILLYDLQLLSSNDPLCKPGTAGSADVTDGKGSLPDEVRGDQDCKGRTRPGNEGAATQTRAR